MSHNFLLSYATICYSSIRSTLPRFDLETKSKLANSYAVRTTRLQTMSQRHRASIQRSLWPWIPVFCEGKYIAGARRDGFGPRNEWMVIPMMNGYLVRALVKEKTGRWAREMHDRQIANDRRAICLSMWPRRCHPMSRGAMFFLSFTWQVVTRTTTVQIELRISDSHAFDLSHIAYRWLVNSATKIVSVNQNENWMTKRTPMHRHQVAHPFISHAVCFLFAGSHRTTRWQSEWITTPFAESIRTESQ